MFLYPSRVLEPICDEFYQMSVSTKVHGFADPWKLALSWPVRYHLTTLVLLDLNVHIVFLRVIV